MTQVMPKRSYSRRTPEQRLHELEAQLAAARAKLESEKERNSPLRRDWTKAQKALRKFIQTATDEGRSDLALSAEAFTAGTDRSIGMSPEELSSRRRGRSSKHEDES
ncbi:MAG: hypothetical protein JNL28_11405 [Planctomycetes bacterium]|nr:hypothetical protein [Planctomycetota bacterium]